MNLPQLLSEFPDDAVFNFSGDAFLASKIKPTFKSALNASSQSFSDNLANQNLKIQMGQTEFDAFGRSCKIRWKTAQDWFYEGANCEILEPNNSG